MVLINFLKEQKEIGSRLNLIRFLLLFTSFFCASTVDAQKKEVPAQFSESKEAMLEELENFFDNSGRSEFKDILKRLEAVLLTPDFEDDVKDLREVLNAMRERKMAAYPYFVAYFPAFFEAHTKLQPAVYLRPWQKACMDNLNSITNKQYGDVDDFYKFSELFFRNKYLVDSRAGADWFVSSDKAEFDVNEDGDFVVRFKDVDISSSRKSDSLIIEDASGTFNLSDKKWSGKGGKITWWRYNQPEIYCQLDTVKIDLKRPLFEIENVEFFHPRLFPGKSLKGKLSEKVYMPESALEGDYPKFDGYEAGVNLDKLIKGIEINGAFSLHGTTVFATKSKGKRATFSVNNGAGKKNFDASSNRFKISPTRIYAKSSYIYLYVGKDTIMHPAVSLDYSISDKQLKLAEGEGFQAQSPYFNSYHRYNFSPTDVIYDIEGDSIIVGRKSLGLAKVNAEVNFDSPKYFRMADYLRVQNIGSTNPIAKLNNYSNEIGTNVLDLPSVINEINPNLTKKSIQTLLVDLVRMGFIDYNVGAETITVKDKTFHYAEAAKKNTDYDNFKLISDSKEENGVLDLKTMDFLLKGVKKVSFSDSQKVAILPFFDEITLQEDNQLHMHGKLFAGYSTLEGLDFYYDYAEHKIRLDSVKFFQLYIPTGRKINGGEDEAVALDSKIESMSAVLRIDAPNNKAALVNVPIFPSIHSRGKSYIYYDEKYIQKGVYTRDSFYFQLDEFDIDALDQLDSNEIVFSGELHSKSILETFRDSAIIREDRSLGVLTMTPEAGFSLYRDRGRYTGQIDLSNKGLYAQGKVNYLKAEIESEDILFLPEQMTASAEKFELVGVDEPNETLPDVKGIDVSIDWKPYTDSMYIRSAEAPFQLYYPGLHQFKGLLIYTPSGLKGNGELDWAKGAVKSELLSFGYYDVNADTLDLNIRAAQGEALAFNSLNLKGEIDYKKEYGKFEGNTTGLNTYMPANQFKTNFNDFDWDLANDEVIFRDKDGGDGIFISTHPDMDSLDIIGYRARYDLLENELVIKGVEEIMVADAVIVPSDSTVTVRENALIDTLYDARIIADTISRYHEISRAKVALKGKKDYTASGFYQYNILGKEQEVLFDNIVGARVGKGERSEKRTETRASGVIETDQEFYIDHKTLFQGSIQLKSQREALAFKGFARFDMPALTSDSTWFSVDFIGDKNDLKLAFDTPKTLDDQPCRTGIFINRESAFLYPSIMRPLFTRKDRPIMDITGLIDYIPEKDRLMIGDSALVEGTELRGNIIQLECSNADIKATGRLNICEETELVNVKSFGTIKTRDSKVVYDSLGFAVMEAQAEIDLMAGINFFIPDPLKKHIVKDISGTMLSAIDAKYNDKFYDDLAMNYIENDEDITAFSEQLLLGNMVVPDKYNGFDLFFGKMNMKWVPDYQSFVSTKKTNALISVDNLGIHKKLESYIEFKMPSNGDDRAYCYLGLPNGNYYFFGMKDATLFTYSNNGEYNEKVDGLKGKDSKIKVAKGIELEVVLSEEGTAQRFVSRVKDKQ